MEHEKKDIGHPDQAFEDVIKLGNRPWDPFGFNTDEENAAEIRALEFIKQEEYKKEQKQQEEDEKENGGKLFGLF